MSSINFHQQLQGFAACEISGSLADKGRKKIQKVLASKIKACG
jgi:hypothetical protein